MVRNFLQRYTDTVFLEIGGFSTKVATQSYTNHFYTAQEQTVESVYEKPLVQQGMIQQFDPVKEFIHTVLQDVWLHTSFLTRLFGATAIVSLHHRISEVSVSALRDVLLSHYFHTVHFVEEGVAAGYAFPEYDTSRSQVVCHIGFDCVELTLLKKHRPVHIERMEGGMRYAVEKIRSFIEQEYQFVVAAHAIHDVLAHISLSKKYTVQDTVELFGKDFLQQTVHQRSIPLKGIQMQFRASLGAVLKRIQFLVAQIPVEDAQYVAEHGVCVSGGCAQIDGVAQEIEKSITVPVQLVDSYPYTIIQGLQHISSRGYLNDLEVKNFILW